MYRVVVNVSGRRARIVPEAHKLMTAERDFGTLSVEDALANKETLHDAVLGLLADKGITNAETYSVELPDELRTDRTLETQEIDKRAETADKGPVADLKTEENKDDKKGEKDA